MLISVDGKISTGSTDVLDFDSDFANIEYLKQGKKQFHELEQQTDLHNLNSGKVFAKMGANEGVMFQEKIPVTFVLIDSKPHLTKSGVEHLLEKTAGLILVTTKNDHPATKIEHENLSVIHFDLRINFEGLFSQLWSDFNVRKLTIQSGGTLNAVLTRDKLIDEVSIVIAPLLVGGEDTPSLIDGPSLTKISELKELTMLELAHVKPLRNSYLHLVYKVRANSGLAT